MDEDTVTLALRGSSLTASQVDELKDLLTDDPNDLKSRILLLGYYFHDQFRSKASAMARLEHIAWIVNNKPDHKIAGIPYGTSLMEPEEYSAIRPLWLDQIERFKHDQRVLANAAQFFIHEDKELSEQCLLSCKTIDPHNKKWADRLAFLYELWGPERAKERLSERELILKSAVNKVERFHALTEVPECALAARDIERAAKAARRLLAVSNKYKNDARYGNAIQAGHTTLGRIALLQGDIEKAKGHLHQSANCPGSPEISMRGPNFTLAEELLAAGEKEAVLSYVRQCKPLCGAIHKELVEFHAQVERFGKELADRQEEYLEFERQCKQIEFENLQEEPASQRRALVEKAMKKTKETIESWLFSEEPLSDDEEDDSQRRGMLQIHSAHLARLKELLDR